MRILHQLAVVVLAMNVAAGVPASLRADTASNCAVTIPNLTKFQWYGNSKLRVGLYWPDGTVVFRPGGPGFITPDGSLGMKFGWWRGARGKLSISGKRLDAPAPRLRAQLPEGYGYGGFESSYLIFPTSGCWEVTGKVGEAKVIFVTRVVKIGNGPDWHRPG